MSPKYKFGALIAIILATLAWLAYTGIRDSASYFVTVTELQQMSSQQAHTRALRVSGEVVPGSIHKGFRNTTFEIRQGGHTLPVDYIGTDPLPDTFVDKAQAVADGRLLSDGVFRAQGVQAKCASKYEPKGVRGSGVAPTTSAGSMN